MNKKKQTRRDFIKTSAGTIASLAVFPYIIPSSILGRNNFVPPSDKIRIGCIGIGWQGTGNMQAFLREKDTIVMAVCDIDKNHLKNGKILLILSTEIMTVKLMQIIKKFLIVKIWMRYLSHYRIIGME